MYRAVLDREPGNPDALHLSGVLALQTGDPRLAVERILRAIAIAPTHADYHCHLGEAYRLLGDAPRAAGCCRAALTIDPDHRQAMNNLGIALLDSGKLDEAREILGELVRVDPGFAMAHCNLGNALRLGGDREGALAAFRRAVEIDPACAEAHSNLGQLLLDKGERNSALEHCRRAVVLQPRLPQALNNLGNALREAGALDEAKRRYAEALDLDPHSAMALGNMAQALQEEGRLGDALGWYENSLRVDSSSARTYANLGSCLEEMERSDDARRAYEEALAHDPHCAEAHAGLAGILRDRGEPDRALAHYRRAIAAKPDLCGAYTGLALLYEQLGRFADAEASLRQAIRCDPEDGTAFEQLAMLLGGRLADEDLGSMYRLARLAPSRASRMQALHFGLAHALDARREFAEAVEHARAGNALQAERWKLGGQPYDPEEHHAFVERSIEVFTPKMFQPSSRFGVGSELPVFLVGLPRSGSTLIEQVLSSHPRMHGAGELTLVRQTFDSLPAISGVGAASLDCVPRLDERVARTAASRHLASLRALAPDAERIIDKMPDNYLYFGLLHILFPKARIIHCRRDLRDVALSCWMTSFRFIRWASQEEHIASRFREYRRIMEHWERVLPKRVLEVRYEDVVANLESVARQLVDWIGLDWDDRCLAFEQNRRAVRTASVVQVRQPLYRSSVGRWRHYEPFLRSFFHST